MTGIKIKSLTEKAMLVSVNIKSWNVTRKDQSLLKDAITEEGWSRGNKKLAIDQTITDFNAIVGNVRKFHQTYTSPWADEGNYRILASVNYAFYRDKMRGFSDQLAEAKKAILAKYPEIKENAKIALKNAFNELDYPDINLLESKFAFNVSVIPIPESNDFRITQISDEDIDEIRQQITAKIEESQKLIMNDLWQRLYDVVNEAAVTFADPDKKFKNSKIENIEKMIEILRKMNVENDPQLDRMINVVDQRLTTLDPDEIRKEPEARKDAAETAQGILDRISSYM